MTELVLQKLPNGTLAPVDPQGIEYVQKMKVGAGVSAKVKKHNNLAFHKKMMTLFHYAFDIWEPEERTYKGQVVAKEFTRFRKDLTILAGYYDAAIDIRGDTRLTAKSLNFSAMDQDEREKCYSAVINAILKHVLKQYTRDDLDAVVERVLQYT